MKSLRALLRILLVILALWILYLSLIPFVAVDSWAIYWDRLVEGMRTIEPGTSFMHILPFVLLGLLLGMATATGQSVLGFSMVLVLPDFCLTIELLQAATTTGDPRLGDLLLQFFVAWFLHALASRILVRSLLLAWLATHANGLCQVALGLLMILFLASPFFGSVGASLGNRGEVQVLVLLSIGLILAWLLRQGLPEFRRRGEALLGLVLTVFYLMAGYWTDASPDPLTLVVLLLGIPIGDLLGTWVIGKSSRLTQDLPPRTLDEVP